MANKVPDDTDKIKTLNEEIELNKVEISYLKICLSAWQEKAQAFEETAIKYKSAVKALMQIIDQKTSTKEGSSL
jgi:hypothetical protein